MRIDRRKLLALLGMSPTLLASSPVRAQQARKTVTASGTERIVGLNPRGTPPPIHLIPMAPRLNSLDGKTIYLVDTGFPGGGFLLHEMQKWFNQNMPSVTVVFRRKTGPYFDDDPPLWREIKAKGNAAIMAVGH